LLKFKLKNNIKINYNNFQAHPYHLVEVSPWPLLTSFALLTLTVSAVL
jgi:cytochrome c oxidase subunit 3